jgi:hypothetical protein
MQSSRKSFVKLKIILLAAMFIGVGISAQPAAEGETETAFFSYEKKHGFFSFKRDYTITFDSQGVKIKLPVSGGGAEFLVVESGHLGTRPPSPQAADYEFLSWEEVDEVAGLGLLAANGKVFEFTCEGETEKAKEIAIELARKTESRGMKLKAKFLEIVKNYEGLDEDKFELLLHREDEQQKWKGFRQELESYFRDCSYSRVSKNQEENTAALKDGWGFEMSIRPNDHLYLFRIYAVTLHWTASWQELRDFVAERNGDPFSDDEDKAVLLTTLSEAEDSAGNMDAAIIAMNSILLLGSDSSEVVEAKRNARKRIQEFEEKKKTGFTKLPKERRDLMLCTTEIPNQSLRTMTFGSPMFLKTMPLRFEVGHPQEATLYACHPLRPECYYPVARFHDILFDDKRTELRYLLESLGATHIRIETIREGGTEAGISRKTHVAAEVGADLVAGASVDVKNAAKKDMSASYYHSAVEEFDLHPSAKPHVPNDLVWYHHESGWQRFAQGALQGRYKALSVELVYREDFGINENRMTNVQAELKYFTTRISGGWDSQTEKNLRERKSITWHYTATFGQR